MRAEWLGLAALVLAPPLLLLRAGARTRWFVGGILSWACALVLKMLVVALLYKALDPAKTPPAFLATAHGFVSAAAELGMTALFFRGRTLPLRDVLAFGVGIGVFEVFWALVEGSAELADAYALSSANVLAMISGAFLLERMLALVGHVSSRVLIYVAIQRRWELPAYLAVGLFTLVDGVAVYGVLAGWNWENPTVWARFMLFVATIGLLEATSAWRYSRGIDPVASKTGSARSPERREV